MVFLHSIFRTQLEHNYSTILCYVVIADGTQFANVILDYVNIQFIAPERWVKHIK